jgi:hypothetical protein
VTWYQFHIGSSAAQWNLRDGIWVDVLALSLQPNQWGGKFAYQGEGVLSELRVEWMRGVTELAFSTGLRWANLIGLDSPGPSESSQTGRRAAECRSRRCHPAANRQVPDVRFFGARRCG